MRILIVQTSFLGDVVLSTPVFAAVRRSYPEAHVSVLVRPESAGVLAAHPAVDAVLTDDKRGRHRGLGSRHTLRALRDGRFDVALALHKSLRTAWLLAAARIPLRVGFRQSPGWFLYHRRVRRDPARHDVERNLSLLSALGLDPAGLVTRPFVACAPAAGEELQSLLSPQGVAPDTPLAGVAPGSVWATKRWTVDGFAALLRELPNSLGLTPLLLGAGADAEYAEAVQRRAGGIGVNLVGRTSLPVAVAAIDRCRVLITNDSAPMHIGVARDTPVVALFGPTVPAQGYGPFSARAVVVERRLSCRPCSRHGAARCPLGTHACMREIEPGQVLQAAAELLRRDSAAAPRKRTIPDDGRV